MLSQIKTRNEGWNISCFSAFVMIDEFRILLRKLDFNVSKNDLAVKIRIGLKLIIDGQIIDCLEHKW